MIRFLLIFLSLAAVGPVAPAWAEKELARISTVAGEVRLMEGEEEKSLLLGGDTIHKATPFMAVYRFFRRKSFDAILLRDFTGPIACPVQFVFLTFRRNGAYRVSRPFGHCSDKPKISSKGHKITIEFDAFGSEAPATWVFDGKALEIVK